MEKITKPKIKVIDRREKERKSIFYDIFPGAPLRDALPYDIQDGLRRVLPEKDRLYIFDDEWQIVSNERSVYDGEVYNIVRGSGYELAFELGERIRKIKRDKIVTELGPNYIRI